ncbi:MAG: DoxX family protein [Emcibacter sp.]|nr:DoxX family protein [Emcibacter sp.]
MNGDRLIEIVLWVLSLVLAIVFFYNGISKIIGSPHQIVQFEQLGLSKGLLIVVGFLECLAGLMLTIPRLALIGGAVLGLIMVTSAGLHLFHDDYTASFRAIVIVVMLAGICYFRHKYQGIKNNFS